MRAVSSNLRKIAKQNVNVSHKNSDGSVDVLKKSPYSDISDKSKSAKIGGDAKIVGLSLGVTKNMDNYESLRVDAWVSDSYETESEALKKFAEMREVLSDVLEETVRDYM